MVSTAQFTDYDPAPAAALRAYGTSLDLHRKARAHRAAAAVRRAKRAAQQELENGDLEGATPPPADLPLQGVDGEEPLPAKLLNNAAVLQLATGHTSEALQLVEEAIQVRFSQQLFCFNINLLAT